MDLIIIVYADNKGEKHLICYLKKSFIIINEHQFNFFQGKSEMKTLNLLFSIFF